MHASLRAVGVPEPYDGRFTLARLWYPMYPGWSFDWPDMEDNLGRILPEITALRPHPNRYNIFRMDDPELLRYPVAYLSEPGYWYPRESEVMGLRRYIEKGGFLIVDDFRGERELENFKRQMKMVFPDRTLEELLAARLASFKGATRDALVLAAESNPRDANYRALAENRERLESARDAPGCRIFIGSENRMFALSGSSVIAAPYRGSQGEVVGVVGVIGPTRLNYARVVPMVDFTAQALTRLMA